MRPKGYRLGRKKGCFAKAGDLALLDRGTYVEGFALIPGFLVTHHAWLTLDGTNAVDVAWRWPAPKNHYFGIAFPKTVLSQFVDRTEHWGPLLEDKLLLAAYLSESLGH
jgi:hypothetical protein